MRVLHIAPSIASSYGGPTQCLRGYLAASRLVGIEASVAAPAASPADVSAIAAHLESGALHLFNSFGRAAAVASPGLITWLARNKNRFDVVHVHGLLNPVSSISARLAVNARRPTIICPFGTLSRYTARYRRARLKAAYTRVVDRPNIDRAAGLHFSSDGEVAEAGWHGIEMGRRAFVVPPPYVGPAARQTSAPSMPRVVFVGRLHPVKNLESLLVAWPEIVRRVPGVELIIAGDGDPAYVRDLRQRAAAAATRGIEFTGFADAEAKDRLLRDAALVVLPSLHENFGMAALEAVAYGVPLVVSDRVQISNDLASRGLAQRCAPTPAALADAIVRSLDDASFRRHCGVEGPRFVDERFSPTVIGEQLLGMYREVLAG